MPWIALGEFMCSREVHRDIGGPIFSQPGSVFFVARDDAEQGVIGFCALSNRGSTVWYDSAYVVPHRRGEGVFTHLAGARDEFAKLLGKPVKTAVKPERWHHYETRGFVREFERDGWVYGVRT